MSHDTRARKTHMRPATGAFLFDPWKPKKLAGCFGGLTAGQAFSVGSSIGQVPEPAIASLNELFNTFNVAADILTGGLFWILNGGAAISAQSADQWDGGFIPARITSNNGIADFISTNNNNPAILPATQYTMSGQFTVDPALGNPNPSSAVRMAVNFTGGIARRDSIDFNPLTGNIIAVSAGITNVKVSKFSSFGNGKTISIVAISCTPPASPAGTNNATFEIYPNVNAGIGVVEAGAFQLEPGTIASAFISSGAFPRRRAVGVTPRNITDRSQPYTILNTSYSFVPGQDDGCSFLISSNGVTFTLPATAAPGAWVDVFFNSSTFFTVTAAVAVVGAGLPTGGSVSVRYPYDGTVPSGGSGPYNVSGVRFTHGGATFGAAGQWVASALAESHGISLFSANGTFLAANGVTRIWINGSGGGGGGGGGDSSNSGGGGGNSGASTSDAILTTVPGTSYTVTIGSGGNGGAGGPNNGTAGTATSIGALFSMSGGDFGLGAAAGTFTGSNSVAGPSTGAGTGGSGYGTTSANFGGRGAANIYTAPNVESKAANPNGSANGAAGNVFGGGGSGGTSGTGTPGVVPTGAGGNGAAGFLSVKW